MIYWPYEIIKRFRRTVYDIRGVLVFPENLQTVVADADNCLFDINVIVNRLHGILGPGAVYLFSVLI